MNSQTAPSVLVVEDDFDIRETLSDVLRGEGYRVEACENGLIALEHLRLRNELPCLILLDAMMPVMDGYSFREEQLKDFRLSAIPVVMLSADRRVESRSLDLKIQKCLRKPIELGELVALVESYCPLLSLAGPNKDP
jgi:CheY-like chemotaxis protein